MKMTRALTMSLALAVFALVLLAVSPPTAHAKFAVLHVTVTGSTTDPACGGTWGTACGLQYALTTVASPGVELWVAAGTYTPTTGTDRTATFQLQPGVALYGGFAMTETLRNERNFTANVTLLSGDIGAQGDNSDNAYHVLMGSGVTSGAVLDGFTVTGGRADGAFPDYRGGGLSIIGSGSLTLTNVTFSGNYATAGGGMDNDFNGLTLANVTFSGNTATDGGGMYNTDSSPTLTNVTFSGNTATSDGGGMSNSGYGDATMTNVTFSGNSAPNGGGMYNYYSSPALTNTTFSGNSAIGLISDPATGFGGGMYNTDSSPTLTNVTFSGNTATSDGGGISNNTSSPTIRNAIFWGNTAPSGSQISNSYSTPSIAYSVVKDGCPSPSTCTHIFTTDPFLGALGTWGGSTQTLPLLPGSSAIDAGDDATCASTDQRGVTRPQGLHCDIGAFESRGFALVKTSGDHQSTLVNTAFADLLEVTLTETGSLLALPGATFTFAAPSSGASAAWSGSLVQTATTNSSGVAQVGPPTANGTLGSYGVVAHAPGATLLTTFVLTNAKADTTTVITSSANPVLAGRPVTFTVTVSAVAPASGTPTGSVNLYETISSSGGMREPRARAALASQPLVDGVATFIVPSLTPGAHALIAAYDGDANYAASTSAIYAQNAYSPYHYFPLIGR